MLVFAVSDKGGAGRSVTSSNVTYRRALQGNDVCYLDFDFGSPTAGAIFNLPGALRGIERGGLHSYLLGQVPEPQRLDIWTASDRLSLRGRPTGAGRLVLLPGDESGSEFVQSSQAMMQRCASLFLQLNEEFDFCLVDLSAGRSFAIELVLVVTALPELYPITARWLVYHRWTRQHIIAASGLVFGERGMIEAGVQHGHDRDELQASIRFVRTAVVDPSAEDLAGLSSEQVTWLTRCNQNLKELASQHGVGRTVSIGAVPFDPVLQWQEQVISDDDVLTRRIANQQTVSAFDDLAARVVDDSAWVGR